MFQHYILYRNPPPDLAKDTEKEPLLAGSEKEGKDETIDDNTWH